MHRTMVRWWRIAALGPLLLLDGCYFFAKPPPPAQGPLEHGIASWYGPGFHGKRTSSGMVFDQNELTAAHPTLPLGSRVLVTNEQNGKKVEVVINDRGPFVSGRVIDLSRAAAERLGMLRPGTTPVRIDLVALPPDGSRHVTYAVQVAAFVRRERADALVEELGRRFDDAYLLRHEANGVIYFRVRLGPYGTKEQAQERARSLVGLGWPALVVEENRK